MNRAQLLTPPRRWRWQNKFWLCWAIEHQIITFDEAEKAHRLSHEEMMRWYIAYKIDGPEGLQSLYRRRHERLAA